MTRACSIPLTASALPSACKRMQDSGLCFHSRLYKSLIDLRKVAAATEVERSSHFLDAAQVFSTLACLLLWRSQSAHALGSLPGRFLAASI